MLSFNKANSRFLLLLLNLVLLMAAQGAELSTGNFGAALPSTPRTPAKSRKETTGASRSYPFYGTLESIDPGGKFMTLKGKTKNRQILLSPKTRCFKDDQPATLSEAIAGNRVSGSVRKNKLGQEEAITVHIGEKASSRSRKKIHAE